MDERRLLIALNAASNITRAALCRLAQATDPWLGAAAADAESLATRLGVPAKQLRRAFEVRGRADQIAGRELAGAAKHGCDIITLRDPDYPQKLRELALPPPVIYCRGRLNDAPALAIVGSRKMDSYGREAAECFAASLAAAGVTIVSGFARGIDSVAHRAALAARGGRTVAVLGCGVDVDYPKGQRTLASQTAERGAVISEFPLGCRPRPWHFPIRNRVIAALSWATLVVQAKLKSGSLITAHHALELGRDVYAVPGRIFDERAMGTNALVADGALVARSPEDLFEGFMRHGLMLAGQQQLFPPPASEPAASADDAPAAGVPGEPWPTGTAGKVLEAMTPGRPQTAEDVSGHVDKPVDQVLGTLLELELAGWIRREPGPVYVR